MHRVSRTWKLAAWSKAGLSTSIVASSKHHKILLDCGGVGLTEQATRCRSVFITHAHIDHIGGIFAHAHARRDVWSRYYVPEASVEGLEAARVGFEKMSQSPLLMTIIPVYAGFVAEVEPGLWMECVATDHRIESVGYIFSQYVSRVKPEHALKSGEEKAALGKDKALHQTWLEPQLAYSGDTTAQGLCAKLLATQVVIVECSYVNDAPGAREAAIRTKHVHLGDLVGTIDPERKLVLVHLPRNLTLPPNVAGLSNFPVAVSVNGTFVDK